MLYFRFKFRSGVRNIPPGQGSHCTGVTLKHTVAYVGENSATERRTHQNHVSKLRYRSDDLSEFLLIIPSTVHSLLPW